VTRTIRGISSAQCHRNDLYARSLDNHRPTVRSAPRLTEYPIGDRGLLTRRSWRRLSILRSPGNRGEVAWGPGARYCRRLILACRRTGRQLVCPSVQRVTHLSHIGVAVVDRSDRRIRVAEDALHELQANATVTPAAPVAHRSIGFRSDMSRGRPPIFTPRGPLSDSAAFVEIPYLDILTRCIRSLPVRRLEGPQWMHSRLFRKRSSMP
jgi:hypothetical protein